MFILRAVGITCLFSICCAIVDYCETDKKNFTIETPGIHFTKELSSSEYALLSSFKSLHCCAKGYRSIEWFKDGKAYPWAGEVSSFILYPESANQTIYSQALSSVDSGVYSCRVANDSRVVTHATDLTVFNMRKNYMDVPKPTYKLPSDVFVRVGQPARLFCEAFVGKIDLPDATTEVWWERDDFNMSTPEAERYVQYTVTRDQGQVKGAYLMINKVKRSDFGDYSCSISNTGDQVVRLTTTLREEEWEMERPSNMVPWLKLQFVALAALVLATLVLVSRRFTLSALLCWKLKFSRRPVDDGKEHDVLICYSSSDSEFVVGVLAATLESRYNYKLTLCQLNNPQASAELQLASTLSRRLLVVLSSQWTPSTICPLFKQLVLIHSDMICVPLQSVKDASWKTADGQALRQLWAKCAVVTWRGDSPAQRRTFWTSLRLALPPPPPPPAAPADNPEMNVNPNSAKTKLSTLAKSNESLEVLV